MKDWHKKTLLLASAVLLTVCAVAAWGAYMSNGIKYGALVGLPGRESDLATFGGQALRALTLAVICQSLAVVMISWMFTDAERAAWVRLCIGLGWAVAADIFIYATVRGM